MDATKNYNLPNAETTRPDVALLSNAASLTAWHQVRPHQLPLTSVSFSLRA
jgi:hypothetical protein